MDDTQFWSLIAQSRQGKDDCEAQTKRLKALLTKLPPEEIVEFDRHFTQRSNQAYRWDLWAVAYIINGGCSDDGFEYFRRWLVGQGQAAYEAAMTSPESVGDLVPDDVTCVECESLMYAAYEAYEQITGQEIPLDGVPYPEEPIGVRWNDDDLERLYPELYARF